MPLSLIQSGSSLQLMNQTGGLTTLTLPTGVTLRTDVPPRFCLWNNYVVMVNTPSQPLLVDATGTVRLLCPQPPAIAPILTGTVDPSGTIGGLPNGNYTAKYTYVTQDSNGNTISESDYSPTSALVDVFQQALTVSNIEISPAAISGINYYRTSNGTGDYFFTDTLSGNVLTSFLDDTPDAAQSLIAGPILGTPPRLTTIAQFRGRLWGMGDVDIDDIRYTEAGFGYSWPSDNIIPITPIGSDQYGVVANIPRRDALGCARRNSLTQIIGTGTETNGVVDFSAVVLSHELGVESQESVVVFRDVAYFLWKDGVYTWGPQGIVCISDGIAGTPNAPTALQAGGFGNVRSWFVSGNYFNADMYPYAFAHIDPNRSIYRLFLASAGSTVIDTWVEFNINTTTWWGPHLTSLFTPSSAFTRVDLSDSVVPVIGGADENIYEEQDLRSDGVGHFVGFSTYVSPEPIVFDVKGKQFDQGVPDLNKYFGRITIYNEPLATGTLTVNSIVGELDQEIDPVSQTANMTVPRNKLGRIGQGKHAQIELYNAQVGQDVVIYGLGIDNVYVLGRR